MMISASSAACAVAKSVVAWACDPVVLVSSVASKFKFRFDAAARALIPGLLMETAMVMRGT